MAGHKRHAFLLSIVGLGAACLGRWSTDLSPPDSVLAQEASGKLPDELMQLRAEVERLKKVVPDQAHAMHDVDYHFTNLWFAGTQGNWPLAQFYLNESRSHLRWAVRIIPVRKDSNGQEIKLEDILQAVENSPLKQLDDAVKATDREKFVAAYEFTLTACYACHKAADKPYLRPGIPEHPATGMINLDPRATWPQ
ncbi:hypothetical protein GC176_22565 [bacterium]|nr:hypothetical protein [bacterium]